MCSKSELDSDSSNDHLLANPYATIVSAHKPRISKGPAVFSFMIVLFAISGFSVKASGRFSAGVQCVFRAVRGQFVGRLEKNTNLLKPLKSP